MLMLKNVRLSYPSLFKATAFSDEQTPKFSATFLIEKGSEAEKAIKAEVVRVAKEAFGDKAQDILAKQGASQRKLLKDGDGPDGLTQDGERKVGVENHWILKASNKSAPKVVGRQRQPLTENDGLPYGGCYVNAQIDVWAQSNQFGKFINVKLLAVQFWADGEAFGNVSRANVDAFDIAEDEPLDF